MFVWRRPTKITDGWLVSFPKSGRTWLRVMLDELGIEIPVTHDGSDYKNPVHFTELKPCGGSFSGRKVIFLVRDPRDVVVSYYFELKKRQKAYAGSIEDFIKDPRYGIERVIHFNKAWFRQNVCSEFLVLSYEQLHQTPEAALSCVTRFLGNPRLAWLVRRAVKKCSFDTMKKQERSGAVSHKFGKAMLPGDINDPESYKVRKGVTGGFREYLSKKGNRMV
jgi:hypothetical protein